MTEVGGVKDEAIWSYLWEKVFWRQSWLTCGEKYSSPKTKTPFSWFLFPRALRGVQKWEWQRALHLVPTGSEKQNLSERASWLGVAQWPHRHPRLRACQSVTVCWAAAPVVRQEFTPFWWLSHCFSDSQNESFKVWIQSVLLCFRSWSASLHQACHICSSVFCLQVRPGNLLIVLLGEIFRTGASKFTI